jgi:peptide/nickel transport system ATP-binding protein
VSETVLDVGDLVVDLPVAAGTLHAVRGISFSIAKGETLCLVGESGCGKSMTAFSIMDLLPPRAVRTASRLSLAGEDLVAAGPQRWNALRGDRMAMIFQEPMTALNPAYTIGDQLTEHHRLHKGSTAAEARERAVFLLEKVGIANAGQRLGQYPHQLSGGLRQRVMIAMALMCGPDLIVADEPTTALDVTIQAQILRLLMDLQKEFGIALLLITHDLGVVARMAHRVAVMYAGEIVETGTSAEVFGQPKHPYTLGLMDCIPVPGRTLPGDKLGSIPGVVPSLVGDIEGCAFRTRCQLAEAACAGTVPIRSAGDHGWACLKVAA